jgi:hypothetical protein
VSRRYAVGDEGTEVAEGSRDIRVEAGECTDLRGPAENPDLPSRDGFLRSFRKQTKEFP